MAILNYTTKIDHWKSIGEIQEKLSKRGAQNIVIDIRDELPQGVKFSILWHDRPCYFMLPCNFLGVLKSLEKNKKVARSFCTKEQALRVGWRIVKDWIDAQLAIVEAEVCTMAFENNKNQLALPK